MTDENEKSDRRSGEDNRLDAVKLIEGERRAGADRRKRSSNKVEASSN